MHFGSTRILIVGVFYAVALTLVSGAHAVDVDAIDRLERQTRAAYDSPDPAHYAEFERNYERLCALYRRAGRLQELAWTHFNFGYDQAGEAVEREIAMKMAGDAPADFRERLVEHSDRVASLTYADGFRAVLVGTDTRVAQTPVAAVSDQRRFAVEVYHISRALGFNLVPVTTFVAFRNQQYLIRAYVADLKPYALDHRRAPYLDEQLHVLDYLTDQIDRNAGGMGERPGGYTVAFDNKHAFRMRDLGFMPTVVVPADTPPTHISADTRSAVLQLKRKLAGDHVKRFAMLTHADRARLEAKIEVLLKLPIVVPAAVKPPAPAVVVPPAPVAPAAPPLSAPPVAAPPVTAPPVNPSPPEDDCGDLLLA